MQPVKILVQHRLTTSSVSEASNKKILVFSRDLTCIIIQPFSKEKKDMTFSINVTYRYLHDLLNLLDSRFK